MDLEVVGRHALFFDDDTTAAFVNSKEALVEWNSLLIDRYDVRHLLSALPPPRSKRRRALPDDHDPSLESQLDHERYLDLPAESPPSPPDEQDLNDGSETANAGGYRAVPFSYGHTAESNDRKNDDNETGFRPPFPVPEALLQSLPPTEKVHQIIARTATFVSKHGGQSEIVLRVKQGDNPTFGFLMPDHPLHAYFRFLVDHQELLTEKSFEEANKSEGETKGGALSLLGSVYGTGEDEDAKNDDAMDSKRNESDGVGYAVKAADSNGSEGVDSKKFATKEETVSKHPLPLKDKATVIKRNPSVSSVHVESTSKMKKEGDNSDTLSTPADRLQSSVLPAAPKIELPIVEPSSDLKRVIDRIVEFILRNGKEFEAVLAEQDVKHGRFPFLVPSNLYHPYYQKVLQEAEESKSSGKSSISEKQEKKATTSRENDLPTIGTDIPDESAKKEKFKMVIGKPKKDGQDQPTKPAQRQIGVNVDAAAAAAILQAARRGIKNPNLGILSNTHLNDTSQGPSNDGEQPSSNSSYPSSQAPSLTRQAGQSGEPAVSVPVANAMAKSAALAAASEADSSEASMTREQKLKAERLKRAKMFVAMIKSGAALTKTESLRSLSVEPSDSGLSESGTNAIDPAVKEREGSSVPFDAGAESEKTDAADDYNERRSKRRYRSRSDRHGKDDDEEEEEREEDALEERDHKRSRRKRDAHHNRDRHMHKRRRPSQDRESQDRHNHDSSSDSSDDEHRHSRHRHRNSKSSSKHKRGDSSDDEHRRSRHRRKHSKSSSKHKHDGSDDEHHIRHRSSKQRKRERDLEEGEIGSKSDQSKATDGHGGSREASVDLIKSYPEGRAPSQQTDTSDVSDELRAKIRAMLMATL